MPAVVRVKRRIDEEPLGAFVLNGKKRRLDGDIATTSAGDTIASGAAAKDEISTILKFAGTIQSQDHSAISHLARLSKDEAKQLVQQKSRKPNNHTERARQEMRASLHENRFRVVNCLRTTLDPLDENEGTSVGANMSEPKELTIVDIEKHAVPMTTANSSVSPSTSSAANVSGSHAALNANATVVAVDPTQPSDSDTGYVYDLYLPENEQHAAYVDLMDDNYLSVRAFDDLVYEDRFNNDVDDEYDSEDSNQENHAGNEYPDEDDDYRMYGGDDNDDDEYDDAETEDTRHLRHAVKKFVLDDSDSDDDEYGDEFHDQSSEDEDCIDYNDPYVHTVNGIEDKRFIDDADRYGMAYARYKARILKERNAVADDEDDNDDDDVGKDKEKKSVKSEDLAEDPYQSANEN